MCLIVPYIGLQDVGGIVFLKECDTHIAVENCILMYVELYVRLCTRLVVLISGSFEVCYWRRMDKIKRPEKLPWRWFKNWIQLLKLCNYCSILLRHSEGAEVHSLGTTTPLFSSLPQVRYHKPSIYSYFENLCLQCLQFLIKQFNSNLCWGLWGKPLSHLHLHNGVIPTAQLARKVGH